MATICGEFRRARTFSRSLLPGLGDAVQIFGGRLTSNYFDVLGVAPILGRNFSSREQEGADVALVTSFLAKTRWAAIRNVIGRSIRWMYGPRSVSMPATCFAKPVAEVLDENRIQSSRIRYRR